MSNEHKCLKEEVTPDWNTLLSDVTRAARQRIAHKKEETIKRLLSDILKACRDAADDGKTEAHVTIPHAVANEVLKTIRQRGLSAQERSDPERYMLSWVVYTVEEPAEA